MIISPPFLPVRTAGQSDEAWLDVAMQQPASRLQDTGAPEGSFPLSHQLAWHNGIHLQAPAGEAVRAIADGIVIFVNEPTAQSADIDHPQNYNPFDRGGRTKASWTDNGCVIVEHRTEIGSQGEHPTEVVFYSLTMHLSTLATTLPGGQAAARKLRAGDRIWRKEKLGEPGQIYGHGGQIHFEICFDTANLERLIGRKPAWVAPRSAGSALPAPTADGRTDSIFGSIYFYLPASTPTMAGSEMPDRQNRSASPGAITPLGLPMWIKMSYGLGACRLESFDECGNLVGSSSPEHGAEYHLHKEANRRHRALSVEQQAASSPSGWYELLRYGRNIGRGETLANKDLLPSDAAHWRRIAVVGGGSSWADLNCVGSYKFSEADFLPVMGWNFISDDEFPNDQRCDSFNLTTLICHPYASNNRRIDQAEIYRKIRDNTVTNRLKRVWCKVPSEWERSTTGSRYAFVKDMEPFIGDSNACAAFESHLKGISFDNLPSNYLNADWRANPKQVIQLLRTCSWLSREELERIYPDNMYPTKALLATNRTPGAIRDLYRTSINKCIRKYNIETPVRKCHFFGQGAVESLCLSLMVEGAVSFARNPDHASFGSELGGFYAPTSKNDYLFYLEGKMGNIDPGDGPKFRGRGMKQLTGRENYSKYWVYRGWLSQDSFKPSWWKTPDAASAPSISNPQLLSTNCFNSIDAGAWYWDGGSANNKFSSINSVITNEAIDRENVFAVSKAINGLNNRGEPNALAERVAATTAVAKIIMDTP